jgi:hypothetical protein
MIRNGYFHSYPFFVNTTFTVATRYARQEHDIKRQKDVDRPHCTKITFFKLRTSVGEVLRKFKMQNTRSRRRGNLHINKNYEQQEVCTANSTLHPVSSGSTTRMPGM